MPPPPSDQELLASFSPLQLEFHAWYEEHASELCRLYSDEDALYRMIREAWPNVPNVESEFENWQVVWCLRHSGRERYQMTLTDFIDMARSTNFMDRNFFASFCWKMEMMNLLQLVLLGECRFGGIFTGYALLPGSHALWPHLDIQPDDPTLLHQSIMGINLNVHIDDELAPDCSAMSAYRRRRQQDRSSGEDLVRTTDSDDTEGSGGFAFMENWRTLGVSFTRDSCVQHGRKQLSESKGVFIYKFLSKKILIQEFFFAK